MSLTKEEIAKVLSEAEPEDRADVLSAALGDDGVLGSVLEKINAEGTRLLTKDQHQSIIDTQAIPAALKKHVKRSELEAIQAERDTVKAELEKLKAQGPKDDPAVEARFKQQMDDLQTRVDGLNTALDQEKAGHQATSASLQTKIKLLLLQRALLKAGAHPDYIGHAVRNASDDLKNLKVQESNGDTTLAAVDLTTGRELDRSAVLAGWLKENPIYAKAKDGGGGLPPSGPQPPPPPGDAFKDKKPGQDQLAAAKKAGYGPTVVPGPGDGPDVS